MEPILKHRGGGSLTYRGPDFDRAPVVVFWEMTRACALACRHCRAEAQPKRDPLELTTDEGRALLEQIAAFDPKPVVVLTGGDALMRRDIFDLIDAGVRLGLVIAVSPSATWLVHQDTLGKLRSLGVHRISFSLDGACPETHDSFRGVLGSFERTRDCIRLAAEAGIPAQINTTVTRYSASELEPLAELVSRSGAMLWDLFFLVPTGRASREDMVSPAEHERIYHWIYDLSLRVPYQIKVTLGQAYRRVVVQSSKHDGRMPAGGPLSMPMTNDGKGVCFVSHVGHVQPSGFLPIIAGNVRMRPLSAIYQHSPVFRALRDPGLLRGKCGVCPYVSVCGGCRARAYALTGDYLASDPCCVYQPDGWKERQACTAPD